MSSFSPSHTVLSNGVRRGGTQSVWPCYYNLTDLCFEKNSEDFSTIQTHRRIQIREFFKKRSENIAFFYNNLWPKSLQEEKIIRIKSSTEQISLLRQRLITPVPCVHLWNLEFRIRPCFTKKKTIPADSIKTEKCFHSWQINFST